MRNNSTIFYGQIMDYSQFISSNSDIQFVHSTIVATHSEKFGGEIRLSSDGKSKIGFVQPEHAIRFAIAVTGRFHQSPKTPYKIGISYAGNPYNPTHEIIAAKISEVCPESSVLVSKDFFDAIGNEHGFNFIRVGISHFKEINEPVEIYALAGSGLYIPAQNELFLGAKNKNSIAILPFHNTSSEKELDYICDGIAEEIIDSLSKVNNLFVTARSSSFIFKNKEISILDISRKLNVNFILDGSIRKRHEQYRISFQLVDCSSGYNVVSDTLNASFENLYDVDSEISNSILNYFNLSVPKTQNQEAYYIDPNAYSYYLQGKHLSVNWDGENIKNALRFFDKALEIVPGYALALAGKSILFTSMAINQLENAKELLSKAVEFADLSIESDPSIPNGFISKAISSFWMGNLYIPDFENNLTQALALSPCNAEIRMYNGMLFLYKGELKRSLSELLLAKQLDPYSLAVNVRLGLAQYFNQKYEDAFNTYLHVLDSYQYKTYVAFRIAWCCLQLKHYHRALEFLDQTDKSYELYNLVYGIQLIAFKKLKDDIRYSETKTIIEQLPKDNACTFYNLAILNKLSGNREKAIYYMSKTFQHPLFSFAFPQHDEFWKEYHEDPNFQEVIFSLYKGTGNQIIKISSETKDSIELKVSDFLYAEAQDNYTLIVFKSEEGMSEKILRTSISQIENQLKTQDFVRCHRSFLVNLNLRYEYDKIDNKAHLKLPDLDISIPISRSKEKEIKALLQKR
jgi:TolB-like protein/tetratricopeptide (TPR) repeat protein